MAAGEVNNFVNYKIASHSVDMSAEAGTAGTQVRLHVVRGYPLDYCPLISLTEMQSAVCRSAICIPLHVVTCTGRVFDVSNQSQLDQSIYRATLVTLHPQTEPANRRTGGRADGTNLTKPPEQAQPRGKMRPKLPVQVPDIEP